MLEVYALTYHGQPVAEPLKAIFGAEGGTIGRGAGNTLVLPDPERYVSRVQARLRLEAGRVWITNVSNANPLFVNDRELESNEEAEVRDGDELRMGVYGLGVRIEAASMDATKVQRQAPVDSAESTAKPAAELSPPIAAATPPREAPRSPIAAATPPREAPSSPSATTPSSPAPSPPAADSRPTPTPGPTADAPPAVQVRTPPAAPPMKHERLPVDPLQLGFGSGDAAADPRARPPAPTPAPPARTPAPPAATPAPAARAPTPPATRSGPPAAFGGDRSPLPGVAPGMRSRPAGGEAPTSLASRPPDLSGPFADLFGPGTGDAPPVAGGGSSPSAAPEAAGASAAQPLQAVWTELEALARGTSPKTTDERRPAIPADFNAFAQPSQSARNTDDPLAELSANAVSLDSLSNQHQPADDIFAGIAPLQPDVKPVLADPHAGPLDPLGGAGVVDPLALFGAEDPLLKAPRVESARSSVADNVLEIGGFFRPPASVPDPSLPPVSEPSPPIAPAGRGHEAAPPPPGYVSAPPILPADLDLSPAPPDAARGSAPAAGPSAPALPPDLDLSAWPAGRSSPGQPLPADLDLSPAPAGKSASGQVLPADLDLSPAIVPAGAGLAPTPSPPASGAAAGPAAEPNRGTAPQTPPVAAGADPDALLRAFLTGAGIPAGNIPGGLTPELMEKVGRVLAASVQGTLDLIAARGLVKREVQAEVTMIVARNNNPLKFLPDAESALLQMFVQRIPGFMGPVEALEDAFADLRAHEVGMIAGMRAALAEVLRRFDPEVLNRRLKERTLLEAMLPGGRKAKLWDVYADMHEAISREALDDFQALFGKAFVTAYEEEIARVRKGS